MLSKLATVNKESAVTETLSDQTGCLALILIAILLAPVQSACALPPAKALFKHSHLIAQGAAGSSSQQAAPVRIAIVTGSNSGKEQAVVDALTAQLQDITDIRISTVNPDWYVVCNINENADRGAEQIKLNGAVTVKTAAGQVLNKVAIEKSGQDFSLQPYAPINRSLVEKTAQLVVQGLVERAIGPIEQAVELEIDTRGRLIQATALEKQHSYDDALEILRAISADTPHYQGALKQINRIEAEKKAAQAARLRQHSARKK